MTLWERCNGPNHMGPVHGRLFRLVESQERVATLGYFYGGGSRSATLAEAAFYRFLFWHSIQADPPTAVLHSEHTLFTAPYRSERGVRLQQPLFDSHREVLRDPSDYRQTQALGHAMRAAGVEAFEYASARDPEGGNCVALLTPAAFTRRAPTTMQAWFCELGAGEVAFKPQAGAEVLRFSLQLFLVDGRLPRPAA